jgi:hypothetical protein
MNPAAVVAFESTYPLNPIARNPLPAMRDLPRLLALRLHAKPVILFKVRNHSYNLQNQTEWRPLWHLIPNIRVM